MATQPLHSVCVRTGPASIAEVISKEIAPILAEKLDALRLRDGSIASNSPMLRKRISLEFYYERTNDNPWGDFAKWNIIETEVRSKITTDVKRLFPDTEF
jgi:hypothetical protein